MILIKQRELMYLLWEMLFSSDPWGTFHQKIAQTCKKVLMLGIILLPFQSALAAINTGINETREETSFINVGFDFQYYGGPSQHFIVHKDGRLRFVMLGRMQKGEGIENEVSTVNTCLPIEDDRNHERSLFVFWDALKTHVEGQPSGKVLYELQGEAPNRRLVMQWANMYFADTDLPMGTFQIILYESTNQIKYQYVDLNGERARGSHATIGIMGGMWSNQFVQIGCNQADTIALGQAIMFTPIIGDQPWDPWDYEVDRNAQFEAIELYDLTPSVPGVSSDSYKAYTNQAPKWEWGTYPKFDTYEIEVLEYSYGGGNSVHTEVLGNVGHFVYPAGLVHGKEYVARVRASSDNGQSWLPWSEVSMVTTVDTENPAVEVRTFLRTDSDVVVLRVSKSDSYPGSGYADAQVQIATDAEFNHLIHEEVMNRYNYELTLNNLPQSGSLYVRIDVVDEAGNHSGFTEGFALIDKPLMATPPSYSKGALSWSWEKDPRYNQFEIEALTDEGEVVYKNTFYPDYIPKVNYTKHGKVVKAHVRGRITLYSNNHWGAWSDWSPPTTIDTVAPTASLDTVVRKELDSAIFNYSAIDDLSDISKITLQVSSRDDYWNWHGGNAQEFSLPADETSFEVSGLPQAALLYARIKAVDGAGNESVYTPVFKIGLDAPSIQTPVNGTVVRTPMVTVSGKAEANTEVQVYLNGEATNPRILVDSSGLFTSNVALGAEGNYSITADAHDDFFTSKLSAVAWVTYKMVEPKVSFVTPANNATLAGSTDIEVSATDELGIAKVEFYVDDTLLSTLDAAPYVAHWSLTEQNNGTYTIKTIVTNTSGKQANASRTVKVDVLPVIPPVPPTAYTGEIGKVEPATSYGVEPIQITGRAVDRTTLQPVANTPLRLVLSVRGFERKINVATNSAGEFSYKFIPQDSDTGVYSVFVIHPNETTAQAEENALGSFAINRIKFSLANYGLTAARNIPAKISVSASASAGAKELRWVALDEDQPSGSLPTGVTVDMGSSLNIGVGQSASSTITFTATDSAAETGTIILSAFAADSGSKVRGNLRINYKLVQAQPSVYLSKSSIQTGVQQKDSVTETVSVGNRGLVAANNVRVELKDENGKAPPAWIFLDSPSEVGNVEVGGSVGLQITAQPDASVPDSTYRFRLHVSADNGSGGSIPISVYVTQSGIGWVQFDVADIYTATLDENDQPILGVKGATIRLQNEAVLTKTYTLTTDAQGIARSVDLAPGIYLYRISASEHSDISGRVRIRPGVTTNEHIFLDYEVISIEFGVTETTIEDVYDIVLEATFNPQVPAPVVMMEPRAINLAGMQVGEEKTGQLTLTNYGLIQANDVEFTLPESDSQFQYEFFGEVPKDLPPKTRIVIPYRVVALGGDESRSVKNMAASQETQEQPVTAMLMNARSSTCNSYSTPYSGKYKFKCANGDESGGSFNGQFYALTGKCGGGSPGGGSSSGGISGGGGWWGWGGGWTTPGSIPMAPECTPACPDGKCAEGSASGKGGQS